MPIDKTKERNQAEKLYFEHKTPSQIAKQLGLDPKTIYRWVSAYGWKEQREGAKDALIEQVAFSKKEKIEGIYEVSLDWIMQSIKNLRDTGHKLEPTEMKQLTGMITDLTKLVRLEEGQATEIVGTAVSMEDVRKALEKDDFIEIEGKDVGDN